MMGSILLLGNGIVGSMDEGEEERDVDCPRDTLSVLEVERCEAGEDVGQGSFGEFGLGDHAFERCMSQTVKAW